MRKPIFFSAIVLVALLSSCCSDLSTSLSGSDGPVVIYPDYKEVTIPCNIAPLNYRYAMAGVSGATTTFCLEGKTVTLRGSSVRWNLRKWKSFMEGASGKTIEVRATVKVSGGFLEDSWSIYVSEDILDSYLTYRLIEPSFQMYNEVVIEERCVENFETRLICDYKSTGNACMNCHIHGQQRGDLSMYYIRGPKGGAILNRDGKLRKLTLNAPGMLSGTVYGEIHPSGRFGVFSTNIIIPGLHSLAKSRTEVYDTASDLTVADFDRNKMINMPATARPDRFETFPCFSADGNSVIYCVADSLELPKDIKELRYHLVRVAFDSSTGEMGSVVDTLWNANANSGSVCHPKASPDGRWLMFTVSSFGTFPLNHDECVLHLLDLQTGEDNALDSIKGNHSDTFHCWSSDSRWFVFASKRGDAQYSKPYYCHLDDNGRPSKPFVLPQKFSGFYETHLKSFNVPDIGRSSTGMSTRDARFIINEQSETFE